MMAELLFVPMLLGMFGGAPVKLSEGTMVLPTYGTQAPDRNPLFFRPEEVQLAEKHVYPYPFYDVQTADKTDQAYKAVVLENEYIKLCVTPEMGGRLYYALDKTNNYEVVYNNRVVKPALIGTIGAWTSGGVEWNTPHHHRATSLIAVDYTVVDNGDGSRTVWVGEYEKRSQTRWLAGLTLEPGKAYVKVEFKSMNVTPYPYPALCFANTAVHVNDAYQFVFPPDVEMVNFHYVTQFARWPVPNQIYQSVDYTQGEDLSWWNATKQPVSFFVTKTSQDFMGGIDHSRRAGTLMVGDHRIFKGKKVWNWGKNEVQEVWDQKLTDDDGPYAELMMGFYSDNQPDYNVVAPFETKYGTMYLYGLKALDGVKEANKDFAVNLMLQHRQATLQINATALQQGVRVVLTKKGAIIFEARVDIAPDAPYHQSVAVEDDTAMEDLRLALYSGEGAPLIAWQQQPARNEPFPETYQDPLDPREYTVCQDAFFAGLKLEQYGNTNFDYMKYYEAALRLSPNDVLTNTQLGIVYLKRREYTLAEKHLSRAVDVVTGNHTKAQHAGPLYYLGVCYMKQGRRQEALDLLYRATWAYAWTSAGYTLAAQLEGQQEKWGRALDAADRARKANTQNVEALVARTIALRQLGNHETASATANETLVLDPLCFVALNELRLISAYAGTDMRPEDSLASLRHLLRAEPYNYIETATRYSEFGLFDEAASIMGLAATSEHAAINAYPMTYYHLGMYLALAGRESEATAVLEQAALLSTDFCFPYGDESVRALRFALTQNEDDATASYLLGNALADYQHEEAVRCWERALRHKPEASIIYRNIAYLQANHLHNMPDALANIMKAIALNPAEPRYFAEADLYMSYSSLTPEQLGAFLAEYGATNDTMIEIQLMQVKLDIFNGNYEKAIGLLRNMRFHIKEGATFNPHVYWFDAHLYEGMRQMKKGQYAEAAQYYMAALEFPANLEAERNNKTGIAFYYLGVNSKMAGDAAAANDWFTRMTEFTNSQGWGAGDFPELTYFKARAALELGRDAAEAEALLHKLIADGEKRLTPVKDSRHITVSVDESHAGRTFLLEHELSRKGLRVSSYYMQGLGHLALGEKEKARSFFLKAMEADPLSIDPKHFLHSLH